MASTEDVAASGGGAAAAATAGSTSSSTASAAPLKAKPKSWADEADEDDEKTPPLSQDDKAEDLKRLEALRIREEDEAAAGSEEAKAERREGVDEPDDSAITAVTSGDTVYASSLSFEDLNLSKELIQGLYVEMGSKRPSKIQAA